jgi:hypothetical protein
MGNHGPGVSCCGILTSLFGITEMNERIKELAEQCTSWSEGSTWTSREVFDKEKFAELIVKECMNIVSNQTTLDTNEDFREGFNHGLKYAWTDIRKHFGVEE